MNINRVTYYTLLTFLLVNITALGQKDVELEKKLLTPSKIIEYAFDKHQVVMMNEAHSGQKRNMRSRQIGQAILPTAHAQGVRHMAIEALGNDSAFVKEANITRKVPQVEHKSGYLMQKEMRNLIQIALDLGWTLHMYEANSKDKPVFDKNTTEGSNWREKTQAENLTKIVNGLGAKNKLLVWCGNSHNSKTYGETPVGKLYPMGYQFWQISGIEPFEIDQLVTISLNPKDNKDKNNRFLKWAAYTEELESSQFGTLGFIDKENNVAKIISLYNKLE